MKDFVYNGQPSRVVFGPGSLAHLEREIELLGAKRALVLSTPEQAAQAQMVADRLGNRATGIFPRAVMHVPIETAREARGRGTPTWCRLCHRNWWRFHHWAWQGDCPGFRIAHSGHSHYLRRQRNDADLRHH